MGFDGAIQNTFFVALGGALGTLVRQLINVAAFAPAFPIGTVIENVSGALLLGVTTGIISAVQEAPDWVRTGVGVGFCGGYTTMSTFAADVFVVSVHQAPEWTALYVGTSLVFGLAVAVAGLRLGQAAVRYWRRR